MQIDTIRFGTVEIDENKIISFNEGIPGLEEYRSFAILRYGESYPIIWLQSIEERAVCLPVLDTFAIEPDYTFNLDDEDVKELGLSVPEELQVISVVVIPDNIEQMTLNLVAPIVINTTNGKAKQIILSGSEYNARQPVFAAVCRLLREGEADAGSVKEAE